ncbi:PREDICTED: uncharacterized protein LOC104799699 [Tarenaya hassleriana]|uniref:uncharacterized protein LOC104799699 n=1 Tax=Tarenaya hassleriana TaxID=28532 RepID=UPI00053C8038|nr:PREDICTED: uncharacterized protein LOC104799699 [Tarenaya hassleriana]
MRCKKVNPETLALTLLLLLQLFSSAVISFDPPKDKDYKREFNYYPGTVVRIVVSNDLQGLKKPNAGFVCTGWGKVWRKSMPGDRYVYKFKYDGRARESFHHCHLRSNLGFINFRVSIHPDITAYCGRDYVCNYSIRREGLLYKPRNQLFPWQPWPRRARSLSGGDHKKSGGGVAVVILKTLACWFLAMQVISVPADAIVPGEVEFSILIKNEMYGLKRPTVVYQCRSPKKVFRWHKSVPKSEFSWDFNVPPFGTAVVVHRCHFRSSQGTADVEIKTISMTAMLCGGHLCKYVIKPNGIYFVGYETYYPHNIFLRFLELVRPVEKLVEPWKAWSPKQLEALRPKRGRDKDDDDDKHDD